MATRHNIHCSTKFLSDGQFDDHAPPMTADRTISAPSNRTLIQSKSSRGYDWVHFGWLYRPCWTRYMISGPLSTKYACRVVSRPRQTQLHIRVGIRLGSPPQNQTRVLKIHTLNAMPLFFTAAKTLFLLSRSRFEATFGTRPHCWTADKTISWASQISSEQMSLFINNCPSERSAMLKISTLLWSLSSLTMSMGACFTALPHVRTAMDSSSRLLLHKSWLAQRY